MNLGQVTIKDIATQLGVSPSTVSRALKDHPDISVKTKKAVNELAEKLNYQPNIVALSLRKRKTNTLGVIIPEIVHFFFSTIINGIEDVAHEAGYNVILTQSKESKEREATNMQTLFNSRVDGMLMSLSRETTSFEHIEAIRNKGIPIVFFDRVYGASTASNVCVDDYAGAKQAVAHLTDQGCKRIMHIMASQQLLITEKRYHGYKDALKDAGLPFEEQLVVECPAETFEAAWHIMKETLAPPYPDAIFAGTDPIAVGTIKAIKEKGLHVPNDIAVIGFSNWDYGELMEPSLSTVDQPGFEMGRKAARLLINQIDSRVNADDEFQQESIVMDSELVIRNSSVRPTNNKTN